MDHYPELEELLRVSVALAQRAGAVIRNVSREADLQIRQKTPQYLYDPVTRADLQSQDLIVGALHALYPSLKIIAEEDTASPLPSPDVLQAIMDEARFIDLPNKRLSHIVAYVDPLDATQAFVDHIFQDCTVLIGFSLRQPGLPTDEPVAGVIHLPFDGPSGRTLCGSIWDPDFCEGIRRVTSPLARQCFRLGSLARLSAPSPLPQHHHPVPSPSLVVVTNHPCHHNERSNGALKALSPSQVLRCGGTGKMLVDVLEGRADVYFYPRGGPKQWDTCAGEALFRAAGGVLLDPSTGKCLKYGIESPDWKHPSGCIASLDARLALQCLEDYQKSAFFDPSGS